MPQYIVGTQVTTKNQRPAFDPLAPASAQQPIKAPTSTWLPVDIDWILGRISKTPDANTFDYMFYCAQNPKRTHTTTFESMSQADQAIARLRNEKLQTPMTEEERMQVDTGAKFEQARNQLENRERLNRSRATDSRNGGRPGNMNRRMGR